MEQELANLLILKSETIEIIKDIQYRIGFLTSRFILSTNSQIIEKNISNNVCIAKEITIFTESLNREYKNLNNYNKLINKT